MTTAEDYFSRCKTTLEVHNRLRTLLVCDFLKPSDALLRFRINCWSDIPPSERITSSAESILNHLESTGKFCEGNYDFIKGKVEDIDVAITEIIVSSERKIKEIRENALKVETSATEVVPLQLEEETRTRVNFILLAVFEFLICKSKEPNEKVEGLWTRYVDLQTWSYHFLSIWHTEYCQCQKSFGQKMLLEFIELGAAKLKLGESEYDSFKRQIAPSLWITLNESVKCICDIFKAYGASPVSVARSSVLSYWIFDSVKNLDLAWTKYKEEGLHASLQKCFNNEEILHLFSVERVSIRITIKESDYLKYRHILETGVPVISGTDTVFSPKDNQKESSKSKLSEENPEKVPSMTYEEDIVKSIEDLCTPEMDPQKDSVKAFETASKTRDGKSTLLAFKKHRVYDPHLDPLMLIVNNRIKRMLYEINQHLSETQSVLSYLLQSANATSKIPHNASILLKEVDPYRQCKPMPYQNIDERFTDIFSTSEDNQIKRMKFLFNSTCVFLLGEAGCGKTAYCFQILKKWCQKEKDFTKIDNVFYIDTTGLQSTGKSISSLISLLIFENESFYDDHVDRILRKENCLVIVDGGRYFKDSMHINDKIQNEIYALVKTYVRCIFLFPMRPAEFARESSGSVIRSDININALQLIGLDENGIKSFYRDIFAIVNKRKEKSGIQSVSGWKDDQAAIHVMTTTEQSMTKEYEIQEICFHFMESKLKKCFGERYDSIMRMPILGSICTMMLVEEKEVPTNLTSLYLCFINRLVERYTTTPLNESSGKNTVHHGFLRILQMNEHIHRNLDFLCGLGKVAYNDLLSLEPALLEYVRSENHLEKQMLAFSIKTCLIVSCEGLGIETSEAPQYRFLHRSIQDSLAAIYIVTEKIDVFESFCDNLISVDVIIDMSHVITMICGLNPKLGSRISRNIKCIIDTDGNVLLHRIFPSAKKQKAFIREFYKMQLCWYEEFKNAKTETGDESILHVSDIYVDNYSDDEIITRTITLLSDENISVMSMQIRHVDTDNGLSNKVLNDFLTSNTSLASLNITGLRSNRIISSLSFPFLTVLHLKNVQIQNAISVDDVSKPLLSDLPMVTVIMLSDIQLNNRKLGLSSDKGKMPMLKILDIENVETGSLSIELAPDMINIEYIRLCNVTMTPQCWTKFVKSLTKCQHHFDVELDKTNIDIESNKMLQRL